MGSFIPCIDGTVLPGRPTETLAGVPMIVGTNVDEWKLWAPMDPHSRDLDDERLFRRVDRVLPGAAADIVSAIRGIRAERGEPAAPNDLWFAIETERFFRVPSVRAAEAQLAIQPATHVYLFGWESPALGGWLGACHGLEIAFVFGNQGRGELAAFTGSGPDADRLSASMMDAWLGFARTGEAWDPYDAAKRPTMVFNRESGLEFAPRDAERAAVDRVLARAG
jgi:carboxylesterase type B